MTSEKQPVNLVDIEYAQTGESVSTNDMGMREMQQRVYEQRGSRHILVKAPPASGKSRALMFVGLDKLFNQDRKKIIVSVPERSIGASFETTDLKSGGFFADWEVDDNTPYSVEYYWQVVGSADEFELHEIVELSGETGTTAEAELK